jgi:hypothetical protein
MKSGTKTRSHNRPAKKTHPGKHSKKNKALNRKTSRKVEGVNRDNTLANWVAGMESTRRKQVHRGNTLATWVRNAS